MYVHVKNVGLLHVVTCTVHQWASLKINMHVPSSSSGSEINPSNNSIKSTITCIGCLSSMYNVHHIAYRALSEPKFLRGKQKEGLD